MTPTGRRVRCLRLRAPSPDSARQFRVALEDALHTASLPAADTGRVVVIRRLALGRLPPHLTSTALALRLEAATRALALQALPAESPAATHADAVTFANRTEVLVRLLQRLLRRAPVTEWYWRAALPDWDPRAPRAEALRWIFDQAHALPEAALCTGALLATALHSSAAEDLVSAIPRAQGRLWLQRLGFSVSPPRRNLSSSVGDQGTTAPAATECHPLPRSAFPILAAWGRDDDRSLWLSTVLLLREQPTRGVDPRLPQRARAWLDAQLPPSPAVQRIEPPASEPRPISPLVPAPDATERSAVHAPATGLPSAERSTPSPHSPVPEVGVLVRGPSPPPVGETEFLATRTFATATAFTTAGGLLFLVPVLIRLGLPARLAAEPWWVETGWAPRLLLDLAARAGVPFEDPTASAIRELLGTSTPVEPADAEAMRDWRVRIRRWCRCELRLGLRNLIRRPGRVGSSPTHLDVSFDLDQTDLRLRRAGLDLDPGWVPWLGRVVQFHYL